MKKLAGKIFDKNGNLITMENEKLLAKGNLCCWIHRKGLLFKNGLLAETIFYTYRGSVIRTNQRIICFQEAGESYKKIEYIEIPVDEIILCKKSLFGVNITCVESNGEKYYVQFSPRKEAVTFFNELLKK